jgi:Tfp pilus assembly protein FimV
MKHHGLDRAAVTTCGVLRMTLLVVSTAFSAWMVQAAEPAPALTTARYTVLRGETLDRVIQKTLPGSPLRIDILRKAFVDLNPQAFVAGKVSRLQAGAVLQVPDHVQLLKTTVLPMLDSADVLAASREGRTANAGERRSWVRFP